MSERFIASIETSWGQFTAWFSAAGLCRLVFPVASREGQCGITAVRSASLSGPNATSSCVHLEGDPQQPYRAPRTSELHHSLEGSNLAGCETIAKQLSCELNEYLGGTRQNFTVPLDLTAAHGFTGMVLEQLRLIPYGYVVSYGMLGGKCGNAKAARAVGMAMRRNPIPVLVPCHRVIAANNKMGGYTPGLQIKQRLFALEGIDLNAPRFAD